MGGIEGERGRQTLLSLYPLRRTDDWLSQFYFLNLRNVRRVAEPASDARYGNDRVNGAFRPSPRHRMVISLYADSSSTLLDVTLRVG